MTGMDRHTGHALTDEIADIRQSVGDILTTPLGSRVMCRDYGSILPDLVDQPLHDATLLRAYAATVIAVTKWENRIRVQRIAREIDETQPGRAVLLLDATTENGDRISIRAPLTAAASI